MDLAISPHCSTSTSNSSASSLQSDSRPEGLHRYTTPTLSPTSTRPLSPPLSTSTTPKRRPPSILTSKWSETPVARRGSWRPSSIIGGALELLHLEREVEPADAQEAWEQPRQRAQRSGKPMWTSNVGFKKVNVATRVKSALRRAAERIGAEGQGNRADRRPSKLRRKPKEVSSPKNVVHELGFDPDGVAHGPIPLARSTARKSPPRHAPPPFLASPRFDAFEVDLDVSLATSMGRVHLSSREETPRTAARNWGRLGEALYDSPTPRRPLASTQSRAEPSPSSTIRSTGTSSLLISLLSSPPRECKENLAPFGSPRPRPASIASTISADSDIGTLTSTINSSTLQPPSIYPTSPVGVVLIEPTPPKDESKVARGLTRSKTSSALSVMAIDYLEPHAIVDTPTRCPPRPLPPLPIRSSPLSSDTIADFPPSDLDFALEAHEYAISLFGDEEEVVEAAEQLVRSLAGGDEPSEWMKYDLHDSRFDDAEEDEGGTFLEPFVEEDSGRFDDAEEGPGRLPSSSTFGIIHDGELSSGVDDFSDDESPTKGRLDPLLLSDRRRAAALPRLTIPPRNPSLPDVAPSCYHSDKSSVRVPFPSTGTSTPADSDAEDDTPFATIGPQLPPSPRSPLPPTPSTQATTPSPFVLSTPPPLRLGERASLHHARSHSQLGDSSKSRRGHLRSRSEGFDFGKGFDSTQISPKKVSLASNGRQIESRRVAELSGASAAGTD